MSTTSGLCGNTLKLMDEIVESLQASGISAEQLHTVEANQLQIATGPSSPMDAIDALMYTHECVKHISVRYGLRATMAPKTFREDLCTGAHAHLSIHPLSGHEFLAGILENLQALCALGMPSYDSYSRVTGYWNAAGTWVTWGTENRFVPVRCIQTASLELRYSDATTNFYLALLMTLAAGMQGLKKKTPLEHDDCQYNPFRLGEKERKDLGIVHQLLASMKEGIKMKESSHMNATLGNSMKQHYIIMRELD